MTISSNGLTIERLERLPNSGEGSPRWRVHFVGGAAMETKPGAQVNAVIDNSDYQNVPLTITTDDGYVIGVEVYEYPRWVEFVHGEVWHTEERGDDGTPDWIIRKEGPRDYRYRMRTSAKWSDPFHTVAEAMDRISEVVAELEAASDGPKCTVCAAPMNADSECAANPNGHTEHMSVRAAVLWLGLTWAEFKQAAEMLDGVEGSPFAAAVADARTAQGTDTTAEQIRARHGIDLDDPLACIRAYAKKRTSLN